MPLTSPPSRDQGRISHGVAGLRDDLVKLALHPKAKAGSLYRDHIRPACRQGLHDILKPGVAFEHSARCDYLPGEAFFQISVLALIALRGCIPAGAARADRRPHKPA